MNNTLRQLLLSCSPKNPPKKWRRATMCKPAASTQARLAIFPVRDHDSTQHVLSSFSIAVGFSHTGTARRMPMY